MLVFIHGQATLEHPGMAVEHFWSIQDGFKAFLEHPEWL
jgi:hypothetical protein